ncbi:MAG: YihY/virulence factor BrkB family protein [Mogibacterium sp.]|nr:YihY/virulence factor BrkB family protein [Mogibacterium sp.]MBR3329692.1 YihY/virulence factor BrkB family protein [Mogibacterium sp.]MBR4090721.1 YihY/virulence factor BrkB family protein [Mogibacterium sp.]
MSEFWDSTSDNPEQKKLHLTWKRVLKIGFHLWRQFDDQYYAGFAAQIAYFFFMASVPMMIVLTQVLGIFDVSMDFIRDWLEMHLSTEMGSVLQRLFSASSTALSSFFMIILALWASSSLAFSLSRLTTYTISYGRYRFSFFTERLKAIPIAALSILAVAVTLVGYVYGELIAKRILQNTYIEGLISGLKTPVLVMLFFIVILANYYLLPRIRVPVTAVLPGAVFATLGILAVTWIYSVYIARAAKYNVLYGAFSNIVAMMLWFYLISWVLCIGMMFNKSWDIHMRRGRLTPAKIKEYLIKQYGANGEEMWHKLIIGEYDMVDRSLDSLAVRMSRKFDPGYDEKREREIAELIETMQVRERIEQEIETRRAELESWDDDQ